MFKLPVMNLIAVIDFSKSSATNSNIEQVEEKDNEIKSNGARFPILPQNSF